MHSFIRAALLAAVLTSVTATAQVPRCPNVLLVFDVSGSMRTTSTTAKDGTQKQLYVVGREAVNDLLAGAGGDTYRWGLELFGDSASGTGCSISPATCSYPTTSTCNSVTSNYQTPPDINAVLAKLNDSNVTGSTPTGAAMETAATRPDMNDTLRGRHAVLITDGNPSGCSDSLTRATTALTALRTDKNVKTYVLGFVGGTPDNLNAMAVAGGTQRQASCTGAGDRCYYEASNAAELQTALNSIIAAVGGEFGGGGCDDSCYAQGCPNAGEICVEGACVADPCANVTCTGGAVCVEGQCTSACDPGCRGSTPICVNGSCQAAVDCSPACDGRNQVCVQGSCEEDYCSSGVLTCAEGFNCVKNACTKALASGTDGGTDGGDGSGGDGGVTPDGGGCCTGAPGAFSVLGMLFALSTLSLLRRRSRS